MDLDSPVCLCFGVSRRKLAQYARVERPKVASQLSDCGGAGSGCGWCVPHLVRLFHDPAALDAVSEADYAAGRVRHRSPTNTATPPHESTPMTDAVTDPVRAWLADFAAEPDADKIDMAFGEVIADEPENVGVRSAALGLAAGEVVAALVGAPSAELPAPIAAWAKSNAALAPRLVIDARLALNRVRDGAEVAGLGSTPAAEVAGCRAAAEELLRRLG